MDKALKKVTKYFLNANSKSEKKKKENGKTEEKGCASEREQCPDKVEMKLKDKGKLFVGGLHSATTTEGMRVYFSRFGKVADANVVISSDTMTSRGYGFVTFIDPAEADIAVKTKFHVLDGKNIDVVPFYSKDRHSRSEKESNSRLFLGGIPKEMKEEDVKIFFARYGEVDVEIPRDKTTNRPKGFGFLLFKDENASKKCLAESFVYLGGRRVQIKKAEPRGKSKIRQNLSVSSVGVEFGVDCLSSGILIDNENDAASLDDVDTYSHSSTTSEDKISKLAHAPGFIKLLEDYFRLKMAYKSTTEVETTEEDQIWQPPSEDVVEIEKILANFLINNKISEDSSSDYNEMNFDSSSDDDDFDDSKSCYDVSNDNDHLLLMDPNRQGYLDAKCIDKSMGKFQNKEAANGRSLVREDSEFLASQVSTSVKIKDQTGALFCSMCQWTPPDGSPEMFLKHCKTAAHRIKLKDRFPAEQIQKSQAPTTDRTNEISPRLPSSETRFNRTEKGYSRKQNQTQKKSQKIKEETSEPNLQVLKQQKQEGNVRTKNQKKKKKNEDQTVKNFKTQQSTYGYKKNSNLKVHALARGLVCIQPLSPHELCCKMCNKVIPKASDFNSLMKNVSAHLQSKRHLNLSETENSLKIALKGNKGTDKTKNVWKNISKNKGNVDSVSATDRSTCKKVRTQNKSGNTAFQKSKFLCLVCNYFCNNTDTFNIHLNSQSHVDSSKTINPTVGNCNVCNRFFFGTLYDINKHYSKCSANETKKIILKN